ncbi:CIMIP2 protein CG18335-like [Euwallacea similis]|uniref:CIMIP2 protein CG18335-like n=1 Tax=Euwallacea similis TaxID=1736056 RepID=UPI00344B8101
MFWGSAINTNSEVLRQYTGFCPQYKYHIEDIYGTTTHKGLLDPTVKHADKIVLSNRSAVDYKAGRPVIKDIDLVNEWQGDTIYKHPIIPGYEEFMLRQHTKFGQRHTFQATEALYDLDRLQTQNRAALNQMIKMGYLQDKKLDPKSLEDVQLTQSSFKFPLIEVRPERGGLLRNVAVTESPVILPTKSVLHFSDNIDSEKYLKAGFTRHIPSGYAAFSKTNDPMTNSSLCKFGSNYSKRLRNEWAPIEIDRRDYSMSIQTVEIYNKHIGQLPSYGGHIPGAIFRYGKTYGKDSRDAKRWLRGDFSN